MLCPATAVYLAYMPFPITAGRMLLNKLERNASHRFPECHPGILLSVTKCCLSQKRCLGNSASIKSSHHTLFFFFNIHIHNLIGSWGKLSFCLGLSVVQVSLASGPFIRGERGLLFPIAFMPQCIPLCSPPASSRQDPFSTIDDPRCASLPALPQDGARLEGASSV